MLQRGDSVPVFEVTTVDGEPFSYSSIWQRKNLLLLTLPPRDCAAYINDVTLEVRNRCCSRRVEEPAVPFDARSLGLGEVGPHAIALVGDDYVRPDAREPTRRRRHRSCVVRR